MRKFNIKSLILILISCSFFLTSCKKDDNVKVDSNLDVIVDENSYDYELNYDASILNVVVRFEENKGTASFNLIKSTFMFKAEPKSSLGYEFLGWYLDGNYTGDPISKDLNYSISAVELYHLKNSNDIELYARFGNEYKITYDLDGGKFSSQDVNYKYITSENIQLLNNKVYKENHTFIGWLIVNNGQIVDSLPAGISGDLTLKALWKENNSQVRDELENTVWKATYTSYSTEINYLFNFGYDGDLSIFLCNNNENVFVNNGAISYLFNTYANNQFKDSIKINELQAIDYDCNYAYYKYYQVEDGFKIEFNKEIYLNENNKYEKLVWLYYPINDYTIKFVDNARMEFIVNMPYEVRYQNSTYNMREWESFIDNNYSIINIDDVLIKYDSQKINFTLEKIADNLTDYSFTCLTNNNKIADTYTITEESLYMFTNTFCGYSLVDEQLYSLLCVVFQNEGKIYVYLPEDAYGLLYIFNSFVFDTYTKTFAPSELKLLKLLG